VIQAAMDSMRPAADGKQIAMSFHDYVGDENDRILGDPDRLQQIIWNLVSNSIKFTPPRGRVTVSLSRRDREFEIEVSDTGQGMTPEFLSHAFDRFRQADSSTSRSQGGLGIGLALARHFTEMHGGSIDAESAGPGLGSRFRIRLPSVALGIEAVVRRVEPPAVPPVGPSYRALTGVKVLLVEDEWDSRDLMAEVLRSAGCEVVATASALEALEALPVNRPDVLVSDIGMPGEDGYSMLRRIRQGTDAHARTIPALAVSAYAREEDRIRSLSAGFQMHMAKPFEPAELAAAVSRLVHRESAPPEAAPAHGGPEKPRPHVLIIEDNADVREGLRQLLEASGYLVEVAEDGLEGVQRALERRPQIALVDLGLPGLDGFGVAERIRNQVPRDEIALVALTGRSQPDDVRRVAASGFDDYLAKPISFEKLDTLLSARLSPQTGSRASD
jgi:CheY-like chemotaxis protein